MTDIALNASTEAYHGKGAPKLDEKPNPWAAWIFIGILLVGLGYGLKGLQRELEVSRCLGAPAFNGCSPGQLVKCMLDLDHRERSEVVLLAQTEAAGADPNFRHASVSESRRTSG